MKKITFSLSDSLVLRMKVTIPPRERSGVISAILEKEIRERERRLGIYALELEDCTSLKDEMGILDKEFGEDGLEDV